jgi:hypothetical protein
MGKGAIMKGHVLEIEVNAEGGNLAYLSPVGSSSGYRIAGPKAWGGSKSIAKLNISSKDLASYIKMYAPDVLSLLTNSE